jgi:prevent-host-death family protein
MKTVSMHDAKTHLSRLVNEALAGEEVVIARHHRPLVRLTVVKDSPSVRSTGGVPGLVLRMDDSFNDSLEDWDSGITP